MSLPGLRELLLEGVQDGVFPSGQATVIHSGKVVFDDAVGGARPDSIFDVASVTKAVGTTFGFVHLWGKGALEPQTPVADILPHAGVSHEKVALEDLLYHRAGLPAWLPFFAPVLRSRPQLFETACPPKLREEARAALVGVALQTPLAQAPRTSAIYSDVGFIILGEVLAKVAGAPLDAFLEKELYAPLAVPLRFHRLSASPASAWADSIPTGKLRPREPAVGQETAWPAAQQKPSPPGEVDDDNAWAMDGVAGHAGLFGTARALARCGQLVLEELDGAGRIAPKTLWEQAIQRDAGTPGSDRALGWDTPAAQGSSAGHLLGNQRPGAVGHLGFTGVSLWVDVGRALVVALCTNCTQNGRANQPRIRDYRPRFHDAVVTALGL